VITSEGEAQAFVAQRCDEKAMERLQRLVELLKVENSKQNLVSRCSIASIWQRHIADSAQLLDFVPRETLVWLDLGSGAGFPGVIIAAMRPDFDVVLVESRKRRIEWLESLVGALGLKNCRVEGLRLEALASFPVGVISARAFAPLQKTLALARRFSTSDTQWLLPKGRSAAQEVSNLPSDLQAMFHVEQSKTDPEAGIVVGRIIEDRR